jgi:photosystem II stability/assembly factor-like uncharacterized protein
MHGKQRRFFSYPSQNRTAIFFAGILGLLPAFQMVALAQEWQVIQHAPESSLRGIAPINDTDAWACGSAGTVLRLSDRGASATIRKVPGLEQSDFRSIHAWDASRCIVATAGKPACIAKTVDGGVTWRIVFRSNLSESFINGMKFIDNQRGIAFGDPIQDRLEIFITVDEGSTWFELPPDRCPIVEPGEAGFAASNSSIAIYDERVWIGLGGRNGMARVLHCSIPDFRFGNPNEWNWESVEVAPIKSNPSSGIFSIALTDNICWTVGGNYQQTRSRDMIAAFSTDRGITWKKPTSSPLGFRSSVVSIPNRRTWIAVGPTGTDIARDGRTWEALNSTGFHSVVTTSAGAIWACGSEGRIGRLTLP